ncbi:General transcription and DNA repair factor IIH subunit TFB5 [Aphelenchoides fujianensis]|nr:General transcription and DNA repair factor IIH subunit TFB5 [Aphelenchoides fujianensis]KAI6233596.1 General transcription and DNA repair factor IIH subunit TFB5 [Aphelenchoides fujianensis]
MVQVKKGTLVTCDPAMLQLLRHLDKTKRLSWRFVVKQLDEQRVIVEREAIPALKKKVDEHMDNLAPEQQ